VTFVLKSKTIVEIIKSILACGSRGRTAATQPLKDRCLSNPPRHKTCVKQGCAGNCLGQESQDDKNLIRGIDPILQVVEKGFGCHYERRPDEKNTLSDGDRILSLAASGI
jgi:hypothetical protein